jgi:hypothetical protein
MYVPSPELGPQTPSPASECGSPQDPSGGVDTFACGGAGGGPDSDEGTESLFTLRISICTLSGEVVILPVFAVEMGRKLRPNSLIGG